MYLFRLLHLSNSIQASWIDATTPKHSGIKQYCDLGFCKSVTQMGQHEDGLSLPSMSGASVGKINGWGSWNHLGVSSLTFWLLGLVLAGTSMSCWPEPLTVGCLWATVWWQLTMMGMNIHETQTCSNHLVRKGDPWTQRSEHKMAKLRDRKNRNHWINLEHSTSNFLFSEIKFSACFFKEWVQYYTMLRGHWNCEKYLYHLRTWAWMCMDLMCK